MVALTRSEQITAPIGSPDARPLASVRYREYSERLGCGESPHSPDAALHLVEYQHRTDPVRGTACGGEEFGGAVPRTGHALDRLEDQRRDCLIEGCLEGLDVVEGNFSGQGHSGAAGSGGVFLAVGNREHCDGPAMPPTL
jgi:hypothetical protein